MPESVKITLQLSDDEAWALAELCKRIGWTELRALSKDNTECILMQDAIAKLCLELSANGISPR